MKLWGFVYQAGIKIRVFIRSSPSVTVFYFFQFSHYMNFVFQTLPVKARFVEYTVQECAEGVTEKGTCQRLTSTSDTEVCNESTSTSAPQANI